MNWKQQAEEIERRLIEKAQQEPAFAELVRSDLQEAVKQATGLDLPFHLLGGLQAAEQGSGELSDDQLQEVAGGAATMEVSQFSGGISGVGTIGGSLSGSGLSKDADASAWDASIQAEASTEADDLMKQMLEVIRDVRNKLQQIDQSRTETNRGIARNI
ncbi:hypothetical protein COLU111180_02930 [Cohnella lubricantis]|uniref:Uncharacterized protein n=1 Tax=Cohnella lubricantis TaxID=2163172 RepID=A0A841TEV4_9BACL|nr:hypothetical protein [Cohnella lubricantis]MBB6679804.1 hypothetical protein [Cohnella lubricantis]MBP2118765.1 hypothetical protein [Cohnella lubricantis]